MNSNAGWELKIRDRALKNVEKFPKKDRERITGVIEREIGLNPYLGDIEKIKGEENHWRRRIGAYRIFYEIIPQEKTIFVFRIERRTSKTY
ncbi:MAG: Addiction module toxin, RelE/StbE family [Parcubacteria group bacterium GW2011_GWB1_43_8]|nr:MAG: Addiction module toxin, RelE/StbE family [Parcubacteria group bacterium GW2011_GWB1_43_8]